MKYKVLFLANHFNTLYRFRKEMIAQMVSEGYDLYLSLPESADNQFFSDMGCHIISTPIDRRGMNPIKAVRLIMFYKRIIRDLSPDIVFSYTIKPNIYGSIANNKTGIRQICNITGTGSTFLTESLLAKICRFLYRISIKHCYKVFFQNSGDMDYFVRHKMVSDNYELLPGSGCNLSEHSYVPMPPADTLVFLTIARLMKLKGIDEFLTCAEAVKKKYPHTRFIIAGWNEEDEYKRKVDTAEKAGYVEYIGFRKDIKDWIEKCHCSVLCSHGGEGVPNVMMESAAVGRVCIGSDINGTRDVIDDGKTGFIFRAGDAQDLIRCVERFINMSDEERSKMGMAARKKMEREFDRKIVIDKYLEEIDNVRKV